MVKSGQVVVGTAGTAEVLSVSAFAFTFRALAGNTDVIYIGDDGSGDVTSANGYELSPGESVSLPSGTWYVDAAQNGEGGCWVLAVV